mgnify:CR=1 FL=1
MSRPCFDSYFPDVFPCLVKLGISIDGKRWQLMKILITAFDPFGGESINPALEAVKLMRDQIEGAEIVKLEIPTVFHKSIEKVKEAILAENPDVVLSVGQAGGRFDITPERVAINVDDARIDRKSVV